MRAGWPQRRGLNTSWLPLFILCFFPPETRASYLNRKSSGIWAWSSWAFCYVGFCSASSSYVGLRSLLLGWASAGFGCHWTRCLRQSASTLVRKQFGFRGAWLPPCWGRAGVATARLHPGHGPRRVGRVRNFLGSVSMQQICDVEGASVTAWLQPRVLFDKERIIPPWGMRVGGPWRRGLSPSWNEMLVAQFCPTLCSIMDYSPPGSSVHRVLQARILEWAAIPLSRGSSRPRDRTQVFPIAGRFFAAWAIRAPHAPSFYTFCLLPTTTPSMPYAN